MIEFFEYGIVIAKPTNLNSVGGIYKIVNRVNGKFYLGRSSNLYNRITVHLCRLRRATEQHKLSSLGHAWRKYGEDCFYVEIVERVNDLESLPLIEQEYLNKLTPWKSGIGYNQDKYSSGFTSETAKSAILKQKLNGRTWNHEQNSNAKISKIIAEKIRREYLDGETTKALSDKYQVSTQTIFEVLKGRRWLDAEDIMRDRKLTEDTKNKILEMYATKKYTYSQLAEIFECSKDSVGRAIRGSLD